MSSQRKNSGHQNTWITDMLSIQLKSEPFTSIKTKPSLRMDDLATQVKELAAKSDDAGRQELLVTLGDLVGSIEGPNKTL